MKTVALIPLRGGSVSIPKKNTKQLAGKPLFYWVANACRQSGLFESIVVSTDSTEIAESVRLYFPDIEILSRPSSLAQNTTSTEEVMLHFAEHYTFDWLCTVQATSPLLEAEHLCAAWSKLLAERHDSIVSCVRFKRFFWSEEGRPLNYDPQKRPRRQDHDGVMLENGAFYFTRHDVLLNTRCRLGGKIGIAEMPEDSAIEIDEPSDWLLVEQLMRRRVLLPKLRDIKLLILDCDGSLTNAGMYYSSEGEVFKKFNARDGKGLELLRAADVNVAIITGEASAIVTARARKLRIDDCFLDVRNKLPVVRELARKHGIQMSQIAFMGDDVNDLESLSNVGFACCPADAHEQVKSVAAYAASRNGGDGAVREVADLLVQARNVALPQVPDK